uniref:Uncharacterized protein n=1 Tax=Arundo donax TaxID=35708 RepID=A0A0A9E7C1_ARUDO
MRRTPLKS